MRRLRVTGGAVDGDALEPCGLDVLLEVGFGEAEVDVLESVAHPLFPMGEQVEHEQLAPGAQDAARLAQRPAGIMGVVQGLAEHRHVVGAGLERQVHDVRLDRVDVGDPLAAGPGLELAQHLR